MAKAVVERLQRIDVRRAHLPRPVLPGEHLDVTMTPEGGTPRRERLEVTFAPCRFGGERAYLRCPECRRRRVALFFWRGVRVACRTCFGLLYRSQKLPADTRLDQRAERIEQRIADGEHLERPRGMHRSTYRRLRSEATALRMTAEGIRDAEMDARFDRDLVRLLGVGRAG